MRIDCAARVIFVVMEFVWYVIFVEYFDFVFFGLRAFVERYDLFGTGLKFWKRRKVDTGQPLGAEVWILAGRGSIHGSWMASCGYNSHTVLRGVRDFPMWTRKSVN